MKNIKEKNLQRLQLKDCKLANIISKRLILILCLKSQINSDMSTHWNPNECRKMFDFECVAVTEKSYLDVTSIAIRLISVQKVSTSTYMH